MYCTNCGKYNKEENRFCHSCGSELENKVPDKTVTSKIKIACAIVLVLCVIFMIVAGYIIPIQKEERQRKLEAEQCEKEEKILIQFTEERVLNDVTEKKNEILEQLYYTDYDFFVNCSLKDFDVVINEDDNVTVNADLVFAQDVGRLEVEGLKLEYQYEDAYRTRYSFSGINVDLGTYTHVEYDDAPYLTPKEMDEKIRELGFSSSNKLYACNLVAAGEDTYFDLYSVVPSFNKIEYYLQYGSVPSYYDLSTYVFVQVFWDYSIDDWVITYSHSPLFCDSTLGSSSYYKSGRPLNEEELNTIMDTHNTIISP